MSVSYSFFFNNNCTDFKLNGLPVCLKLTHLSRSLCIIGFCSSFLNFLKPKIVNKINEKETKLIVKSLLEKKSHINCSTNKISVVEASSMREGNKIEGNLLFC